MKSQKDAENLSGFLEENDIIVPFINYPGNGNNKMSIVRISVTADHTFEQTEHLIITLKKWKDKTSDKIIKNTQGYDRLN